MEKQYLSIEVFEELKKHIPQHELKENYYTVKDEEIIFGEYTLCLDYSVHAKFDVTPATYEYPEEVELKDFYIIMDSVSVFYGEDAIEYHLTKEQLIVLQVLIEESFDV